jgi:hypothetical protein
MGRQPKDQQQGQGLGRKDCKKAGSPKTSSRGSDWAGKIARRQEAKRPAAGTRIGQERLQDGQKAQRLAAGAGIGQEGVQDGQEVQRLAGGAGRLADG